MRVHEFKKNKSPSYSFLELFLNYNSMQFHCPWIMYYYLWRSFWDQVLKRFFLKIIYPNNEVWWLLWSYHWSKVHKLVTNTYDSTIYWLWTSWKTHGISHSDFFLFILMQNDASFHRHFMSPGWLFENTWIYTITGNLQGNTTN